MTDGSEKLQKVLSRAGLGSRRGMEEWIKAGRVSVNGTLATLGDRVVGADVIRVDGTRLHHRSAEEIRTRVLRYHKPVGEVCSRRDDKQRPSVYDQLPLLGNGRWVGIGRLDITTSGLLLFTNHGELANRLMHPSSQVEREYAMRVMGEVSPEILQKLRQGVQLDDGLARFAALTERGGEGINSWFHGVLVEGRNREVRRLWESQGLRVSRLARVRYGPITLPRGLRVGRWDELSTSQVEALEAVSMPGANPALNTGHTPANPPARAELTRGALRRGAATGGASDRDSATRNRPTRDSVAGRVSRRDPTTRSRGPRDPTAREGPTRDSTARGTAPVRAARSSPTRDAPIRDVSPPTGTKRGPVKRVTRQRRTPNNR